MPVTLADGAGRVAQKAATRRRLLDAAAACFLDGSPVTTSVDAVAAAAGVSKATLFFHFGSRLDLLEAVAFDLYVGAARTVWRPSPPGLQRFIHRYLAAQRRPESRLVFEIGDIAAAAGRPTPDLAYRHFVDHVTNCLATEVEPRDAAQLATLVAPALLAIGRRVAFGWAEADEQERFVAEVERLVAPHRRARAVLAPGDG